MPPSAQVPAFRAATATATATITTAATRSTPPPSDEPDTETDSNDSLRGWIEWIAVALGAVLVALLIRAFVLQAFYIPSESMEPTLHKNDRIMVNKLSYHLHDVRRGDLVVFRRPPNMASSEINDLIKRVIALPNETIELRGSDIYIDDQKLTEPYLAEGTPTVNLGWVTGCANPSSERNKCLIPPGHVFVMGDNRTHSSDGPRLRSDRRRPHRRPRVRAHLAAEQTRLLITAAVSCKARPEMSAADWANEQVAVVRDDPAAESNSWNACYHGPFGTAPRHLPYRRAAMSFMRWQLRRGVLQPMHDERPGSPWWRAVNERLLRDGGEAVALSGDRTGPPSSRTVALLAVIRRLPDGAHLVSSAQRERRRRLPRAPRPSTKQRTPPSASS